MSLLHSTILGDSGKDLFILHGFLGMGDNWKTHAKQWVAQGWRVHLIDQRNHGRSFWSTSFNYTLMTEDIHCYLTDNGIESATVLGHSMGGKVAMLLACLYPEMVDQLIVADIAPKTYPSHHQMILNGLASLDFSIIKSRKEADEALAEFVKDMGTRQFLLKNLEWTPQRTLALRCNIQVLQHKLAEIGAAPKPGVYTGNTLFLAGRNSDYIFEPSKLEIVEELIPKSLKTQLYKGIRDSFASEHGARMTAMHKATDNAKELRDELLLTYNKARQAAITNEILEIVGGAEALNN